MTMAKPARRRRPARSERLLRQAILVATEDLLAEHPFNEIRVDDILEASEVGRSSFYLYFESRHAVLAELVRNAFAETVEASSTVVDSEPEETAHETIRQTVYDAAELWRFHGPVLEAMVEQWRS